MKNYIIPFCLLTFLLFSCETDSYEKGQGKYSLMMADMGEVTVNSDKQVTAFTTDDGDSYTLTTRKTLLTLRVPGLPRTRNILIWDCCSNLVMSKIPWGAILSALFRIPYLSMPTRLPQPTIAFCIARTRRLSILPTGIMSASSCHRNVLTPSTSLSKPMEVSLFEHLQLNNI